MTIKILIKILALSCKLHEGTHYVPLLIIASAYKNPTQDTASSKHSIMNKVIYKSLR